MFNASHVAEVIKEANQFSFRDVGEKDITFDWNSMKRYRDRYIGRLNAIYEDGLEKLKVTRVLGTGRFAGPNTVVVGEGEDAQVLTAKHIIIAVGGQPKKLGRGVTSVLLLVNNISYNLL